MEGKGRQKVGREVRRKGRLNGQMDEWMVGREGQREREEGREGRLDGWTDRWRED